MYNPKVTSFIITSGDWGLTKATIYLTSSIPIKTVTSLKNQQKQLSIVDKIVGDAEGIYDKYKTVKDNLRTAVSSYKTHSKSLQNLINNTYGSSRGLESKIKKLKDDHGLSPGQSIKESTDDEKIIMELDDPEEKKVINYKN